jgi:murein DD-endopeptidase MepM/ murein hydrolase activator NlpD
LESRIPPPAAPVKAAARGGVDGVLARLQASLDRVESRQTSTLNALEESFDSRARRMRGVLADLGLDLGKTAAAAAPAGMGGPFIPVKARDANGFDRQIYRITLARVQLERLTRTLNGVPIRKPVAGDIDLSSGFGMRVDPFVRAPAMHSGLDFRGAVGEPARATAAGTVVQAGWNGGYGKMVEIDHGNGLSTRYGHLSEIDVTIGQSIRIGQTIGKIGSTGRSTGPHLHYETRVEGDAVDPQKFLRAGLRLGNAI